MYMVYLKKEINMKQTRMLIRMICDKSVRYNFLSLHNKFKKSPHYKVSNLIRCCKNVIQHDRIIVQDGNYIVNSFFPPLNSYAFYQIAMRVPGEGADFFENHTTGKRLAPISTYMAVTHKCMYRCWHCSASSFMENGNKDMTTEQFLIVVKKIRDLGVGIIGFTGGEPLLRKDLEEAISLVAAPSEGSNGKQTNGMHAMTIVFTTGYGLDIKRARALKEAGLFAIAISLDRIHPANHDKMRGVEGAFDRAIEAIKNAKKVGLYTMCQTVCTRGLLQSGEIYEIAKYAKSLGIDEMRIMEPIPCGSMKDHEQEALTKEEQKQLIGLHIKMNEDKDYPKVSVFPYIESDDQYGCGAGSQHSFVDGDGNFGPCDFLPISHGNLLTEEAEVIWKRMHEEMGKPRCGCYAKCKEKKVNIPKYYRLMRGDIG